MRWDNGVKRQGTVGYECEILISESGKLPSEYERTVGFPGSLAGKESTFNAGDPG